MRNDDGLGSRRHSSGISTTSGRDFCWRSALAVLLAAMISSGTVCLPTIAPQPGETPSPSPSSSCGSDEDCQTDEFCRFETGSCGAEDAEGMCEVIPDACAAIFDPVCGCDGNTYGNECTAWIDGVSVAAAGECQ